jgi:hypothetical protein
MSLLASDSTLVPVRPPKGPTVIRVSYSSLGTFSSCARKFELDKLYPRVERVGEDWYAADVGKALHTGYQNYLTHQSEEAAIWAFMTEFPYELEYQQTNDYRSFNAALNTLEEMLRFMPINEYRLAEIRRPDGLVVPAVEVPFAIRFKGLSIQPCDRFPDGAVFEFTGFADAIMQNLMTDAYRTLDIKTTRQRVADLTAKFKFDTQQVPYGIVVDHVAQGTIDSFEVLYLNAFIDLVSPEVRFESYLKTRTDIQEWAMNKVIQFQQIARFAGLDYFPRTENGCLFYNKPCRHIEVCQSRDRQAILDWLTLGNTNFVEDTFEPWIVAELEVES